MPAEVSILHSFIKYTVSYIFYSYSFYIDLTVVAAGKPVSFLLPHPGALPGESLHEAACYHGNDDHAHKQGR